MKNLLLILLVVLASVRLHSTPTASDLNEGLQMTYDNANSIYTLSWWGKSGRTYFIQQSEDMFNWNYVPVIESGDDDVIEWGFTSNAPRLFFRLRTTDQAYTGDPELADFDGDGISNLDELQSSGGGDPLDYYNQSGTIIEPVLEIISGNHQITPPGQFSSAPLTVRVKNTATSLPLENAPVIFKIDPGSTSGALLAQANLGSPELRESLTGRSDANGMVAAYLKQPIDPVPEQFVQVTAGGATPVQFSIYPRSVEASQQLTATIADNGGLGLTWAHPAPGISSLSHKVQTSQDGGATWTSQVTLGGTSNGYTIPAANYTEDTVFRIETTDPNGSVTSRWLWLNDLDNDGFSNEEEETKLFSDPRDPKSPALLPVNPASSEWIRYNWSDSNQSGIHIFDSRFSFSSSKVKYRWEDISTSGGTRLNISDISDSSAELDLPFLFPIAGGLYSKLYLSSHGLITFDTPDTRPNSVGFIRYYRTAIAALWDQMAPTATGGIYFKAYDDCAVIQFEQVPQLDGEGVMTYQIVLYKNGMIYYYYKEGQVPSSDEISAGLWLSNPATGYHDRLMLSDTDRLYNRHYDYPQFNGDYLKTETSGNTEAFAIRMHPSFSPVDEPGRSIQLWTDNKTVAKPAKWSDGFARHAPDVRAEYHWESIESTGTITYSETTQIPFDFTIAGKTYDKLYLHADGLITFESPYPYHPVGHTPYKPHDGQWLAGFEQTVIAPFWFDLRRASQGKILYKTVTDPGYTSPNRLIIQFQDISNGTYKNSAYVDTASRYTFQAILHRSGSVEFLYKDFKNAAGVPRGLTESAWAGVFLYNPESGYRHECSLAKEDLVNGDHPEINNNRYFLDNVDPSGNIAVRFDFVQQPEYTVSLDEASGPRYRKVSLLGRPLPDEKPQSTSESDEAKEETYIDALTLGLRHATTDVYVPVSGSDLVLTARRNAQSETWNLHSGVRPHEHLVRPFGAGWNSNLAVHVRYATAYDAEDQPRGIPYAYVTDHNGEVHRFMAVGDSYIPMPSDMRENGSHLAAFDGDTFTDRYGTVIEFDGDHPVEQTIPVSRYQVAGEEVHTYVRAKSLTDRLGKQLLYTYANGTDLIPNRIHLDGSPDQQILITLNTDGLVTQIRDVSGQDYHYAYQTLPFSVGAEAFLVPVLRSVTAPGAAITTYTYDLAAEDDLTPVSVVRGEPITKYHLDLASITNPLGQTYTFTYQFNHAKRSYHVRAGPFIQTGLPRQVAQVILPGAVGSTQFIDHSLVQLGYDVAGNPGLTPESLRRTEVRDVLGNVTTYDFGTGPDGAVAFNVQDLDPQTPPGAKPKVIYYKNMQITYDGIGQETFTFDPSAGFALQSVQDLSGHTTTYTYGDVYAFHPLAAYIFPQAGFFGRYADPTSQTNALGHTRTFTYGPWRIMSSITDEAGRRTAYDVDAFGRRTGEKMYTVGNTLVQQTDFAYTDADFPGVVTRRTVRSLPGGPAWAQDAETTYTLDGNGRVASQSVALGALQFAITQYTYDASGHLLTVTDPRLHTTEFTYDPRHRLTRVRHPDLTERLYTYDALDNKTAEQDEKGHGTLWTYDGLNRVTQQRRLMPGGSDLVLSHTYNLLGSALSTTDARGQTTTFAYDALQRLVQSTDPLLGTTLYQYGVNSGGSVFSASGFRPTSVQDALGYVTATTYDALYRPTAVSVTYAPGTTATTTTAYDPVGNPLCVTDPLGKVTTTSYDALNRPVLVTHADATTQSTTYTSTGLTWAVTNELGHSTTTEYDAAGRAVRLTLPPVYNAANSLTESPVLEMTYDATGNVSSVQDARGQVTTYSYDTRNRKLTEQLPAVYDGETGLLTAATTTWQYDAVGNVTRITDARGQATDSTYDEANRLLTVQGPAVPLPAGGSARPLSSMTYDGNGNILSVTDPNGKVTTNTYDTLNRLATTTDASGITVSYAYDAMGNRTSVTDGKGQVTLFTYDGLRRNITLQDPLLHTTTFEYDALRLTARVDALGQRTEYSYDDRHRLTAVAYPTRTLDNRTLGYDAAGQLLTVQEPNKAGQADVSCTYDALGRLSTETSGGLTHTYRYDLAGNRLITLYGGTGTQVTRTYDARNRLSSQQEGGRTTSYQYTLTGAPTRKTLPNGDTIAHTYDALSRTTATLAQNGSAVTLYSHEMKHDLAGNVVQIQEVNGGTLPDRTISNEYDASYRLSSESIATVGSGTVTTTYLYDAASNRTSKEVAGGTSAGTTTYHYNAANQLTSTTGAQTLSYTYNANGNRVTRTEGLLTDTYSYDQENRLIELDKYTGAATGTYAFAYDYRTRRIQSTHGTASTKFIFSGSTSVQEIENGLHSAEYIRGPDLGGGVGGLLYSLRSTGASYTHSNTRGDIIAKSNSLGALTYQAQYEGYGQVTTESGSTADRQRSNSKDQDIPGYANEGFRYRDLESGGFLTKDPAGFVDGPNLYAYVRQNPWTAFDPEGLQGLPFGAGSHYSFNVGHPSAHATNARLADQLKQVKPPGAFQALIDVRAAVLDTVSFGATKHTRTCDVNENSIAYKSVEWAGYAEGGYALVKGLVKLTGKLLAKKGFGEAFEAGVKQIDNIGGQSSRVVAEQSEAATSELLEVSDGVRRSKAAQLNGNSTIKADVDQADGSFVTRDVPVDSLHSPYKDVIDVSSPQKLDRFDRVMKATQEGVELPPIRVNPGSRGPNIKDVKLDYEGD